LSLSVSCTTISPASAPIQISVPDGRVSTLNELGAIENGTQ
jgi:hypothetical protein